jgi:hypothetical protein
MGTRLELHEILCEALGSRHVYFQPPESVKMVYPAIVYSRNNIDNAFADNTVYTQSPAYNVTVIDEDPDSEIVTRISKLPTCRFNRHYSSENLNHDVFTIYF